MNKPAFSSQAALASAALAPALGQSKTAAWFRAAGIVLLGSAFVAVCSHIALPLWFTPVPLTLQPFSVLMLGLLLTPRMAAATLFAYLAEGAAGLPVFTPGLAFAVGFAHLFGPTGGYLLVYPVATFAVAALWRRSRRTFAMALACAAVGNLLILLGGAAWLAAFAHLSLRSALTLAVLPFLPGDALKVAAAAALASGWTRLRRRASEGA